MIAVLSGLVAIAALVAGVYIGVTDSWMRGVFLVMAVGGGQKLTEWLIVAGCRLHGRFFLSEEQVQELRWIPAFGASAAPPAWGTIGVIVGGLYITLATAGIAASIWYW